MVKPNSTSFIKTMFIYIEWPIKSENEIAKLSGISGPGSDDYESETIAINKLNSWEDGYTRKENENKKAGKFTD